MGWLALLKALVGLANTIAGYLSAQQQQEAGAAIANASNLQRAADEHRRAEAARTAIRDDPNWLPDLDDPAARN